MRNLQGAQHVEMDQTPMPAGQFGPFPAAGATAPTQAGRRRRGWLPVLTLVIGLGLGAAMGSTGDVTDQPEYEALAAEASESDAALDEARSTVDALEDELAGAAAELDETTAAVSAAISDADAARGERDALQAQLDGMATRAAELDAQATDIAAREAALASTATRSAPVPLVAPAPAPATGGSVSYENCSEARAAGAAPVRRGDPGYASHLDRDGDGVGCES